MQADGFLYVNPILFLHEASSVQRYKNSLAGAAGPLQFHVSRRPVAREQFPVGALVDSDCVRRMWLVLGLRVAVCGRRPVVLALSAQMNLVSAGVALRTGRRHSDGDPASYFFGTGMDDREDHLRWVMVGTIRVGTWIAFTLPTSVGAILQYCRLKGD